MVWRITLLLIFWQWLYSGIADDNELFLFYKKVHRPVG